MIRRSLAILAVLTCVGQARASGPEVPPADFAGRAWAVTDVVLDRHVQPPARQQMILAGLRVMIRAAGSPMPPGLARRVSATTTPEALAALLAETWPRPTPTGKSGEALEDAFFEGLSSAVPGGVDLLSAKERKVQEQIEGNLYVGIQVALGIDEGSRRPVFQQVLEGGPADRVGAKKGDLIEAIDGASTEGLDLAEVVDRLRGEEGTEVAVRLKRPKSGEVLETSMTRARLPRKTVRGLDALPEGGEVVRLDGPSPIGYLKITEIAGSTPQELRSFADQLEAEGLRALVLDLRGVSRASFHPTVLLADALLDGGTIGRVSEADASREIRAEPDALFRGWPMVVLAGGTRSAEVAWLSAGLQASRGATVLGRADPGRIDATVRSIVPVPGGDWSVRIATGRLEWASESPPAEEVQRASDLLELARDISQRTAGPRFSSPRMSRRPQGVRDEPLSEARALLEAALKSPGSRTPGVSRGDDR